MSYLLSTCAYCSASGIWAWTGKARIMINPEPAKDGNVVLVGRPVGAPLAVVTSDPHAYPGKPRFTAHFADCPGADAARKPQAKHPPQTETLF